MFLILDLLMTCMFKYIFAGDIPAATAEDVDIAVKAKQPVKLLNGTEGKSGQMHLEHIVPSICVPLLQR